MTAPQPDPDPAASAARSAQPDPRLAEITPPPIRLRTSTVVSWGLVAWAIALIVVLAVPELRTGDRSWWPWVPVAALVLGGIGLTYLSRGRGNAAGA